jgi:hypothetical protein
MRDGSSTPTGVKHSLRSVPDDVRNELVLVHDRIRKGSESKPKTVSKNRFLTGALDMARVSPKIREGRFADASRMSDRSLSGSCSTQIPV